MIRIRNQRRLLFDDVMLIFACTTLLAATVLLYSMMSVMYLVQEMTLNPIPATLVQASAAGFSERMSQYSQLMFSFLALAWTTVFAVKFCFLLFFYQMLVRVPNLMYICKIVFGITILCYCICVCGIFIACPRVGLESCKSTPFHLLSLSEQQKLIRNDFGHSKLRAKVGILEELCFWHYRNKFGYHDRSIK